jgi:hypothetical protein
MIELAIIYKKKQVKYKKSDILGDIGTATVMLPGAT